MKKKNIIFLVILLTLFVSPIIFSDTTRENLPILTRLDRAEKKLEELAKYEGFSYFTRGFVKEAHWRPVVVDQLVFNTFGVESYNTTTGQFTAPKDGYYRLSASGYIGNGTNGVDQRMAIGFVKNDVLQGFAGGQLSQIDSPAPFCAYVMYLQKGDIVGTISFTTIKVRFGSEGGGHSFWFQGEYLGN